MDLYEKVSNLDTIFGIWHYTDHIRVTYVAVGWLIVWDHKQSPPTRYDCHHDTHQAACDSAVAKIKELTNSN